MSLVRAGAVVSAAGWVIGPGVEHAIAADGPVGLLYLERHAPLAIALLDAVKGAEAAEAPASVVQALVDESDLDRWPAALARVLPAPARAIDRRVVAALERLSFEAGPGAVASAATLAGLSASHLRALVRAQLGFTLSTWLVWRKLEVAVRAMTEGAAPAEAAAAGRFADQAHLVRTMRRLFGITPGMARAALD